mmetsp:Transcript_23884/g.59494  ORF Transcript_23884/g.59494 Transcript_23884/m.59494 type:complete len:249 (-) Transcript_23884:31-777(-)
MAGSADFWSRAAVVVLEEERTLKILIIPVTAVITTIIMTMYSGADQAFVSDALNPDMPEDTAAFVARYSIWHLAFFSIFTFKRTHLPRNLRWLAYYNLVSLLFAIWTSYRKGSMKDFETGVDHYKGSINEYAHWLSALNLFVLFVAETYFVWWRDKRLLRAYGVFAGLFVVLFLLSEFGVSPDTGIRGIRQHFEIPMEWAMVLFHFVAVWHRSAPAEACARGQTPRLTELGDVHSDERLGGMVDLGAV